MFTKIYVYYLQNMYIYIDIQLAQLAQFDKITSFLKACGTRGSCPKLDQTIR